MKSETRRAPERIEASGSVEASGKTWTSGRIGTSERSRTSGRIRVSARNRLALLAALAATATTVGAVAVGGPEFHGVVALLYLGAALGAIVVPPAIVAQIVIGTLLVAGTLYGPGGPRPLLLLPLLVGVVLTAELLGRLLRTDRPLDGEIRREVLEAGTLALLAGAVGGVVLVAGMLPGPSGPAGAALAAGAAIVVAVLIARTRTR